jgi:ABC-type transport system substrate-binding protein
MPGQSKSQLTISRDEELQKVEPHNHQNIINNCVNLLMYDCLFEMDKDGKIIPSGLLDSYEFSRDGLAWTFHLKKGVTFQNGEPFKSDAVKLTLERLKDTNLLGSLNWEKLIDRVDTPDDYTAIFRTIEPLGTMLINLRATQIIPPKAFAEKGTALFDNHIGTGPYKFVEWLKNERFVVDRWTGSWDKRPKVDRIIHRPIMEESTRLNALRAGDIDIIQSLTQESIPLLESEGFKIMRILTTDQLHLGLKCDQPPFNNKSCRMAMNYAVDRDALVNKILGGGRPAAGSVGKTAPIGFHEGLKPFSRDVEKAKALLREGGYKGEKLKFIGPNAWYAKITEVEQALLSQMQEVGLNIEFTQMEGSAFTAARVAGAYNIYVTGAATGDPSGVLISRVVGDVHKSGYKNDELFSLIRKGSREADQQARIPIYLRIQEIMYEEAAPFIWLYQMEQIDAMKKTVQGFRLDHKTWHLRDTEVAKA